MKLLIQKATTSKSVDVFIQDSSVTTGAGLTGLVYNTGSLTAYYHRMGSSPTAITLATQTVNAAWSSGGFVAVDGTNMPGVYRLDIPDAALATGVNEVVIMLKGAANMVPCVLEIQLVSFDPNDAVRAGLTAMPNVASGSAGAIITSGTGTAQLAVSGGRGNADVVYWSGSAVGTPNVAGYPRVDTAYNAGTAITSASGRQEVNVTHYGGTAGTFSGGIPAVNTTQWRGTQPNTLTSGRVETLLGACATGVIDAAAIAADAIGASELAADAVTEIAAGIKALVIETQGSYTVGQALSIMLAALAGVTSSNGNTIATPNGVSTRITATVSSNNRTAMTLNPSA